MYSENINLTLPSEVLCLIMSHLINLRIQYYFKNKKRKIKSIIISTTNRLFALCMKDSIKFMNQELSRLWFYLHQSMHRIWNHCVDSCRFIKDQEITQLDLVTVLYNYKTVTKSKIMRWEFLEGEVQMIINWLLSNSHTSVLGFLIMDLNDISSLQYISIRNFSNVKISIGQVLCPVIKYSKI